MGRRCKVRRGSTRTQNHQCELNEKAGYGRGSRRFLDFGVEIRQSDTDEIRS